MRYLSKSLRKPAIDKINTTTETNWLLKLNKKLKISAAAAGIQAMSIDIKASKTRLPFPKLNRKKLARRPPAIQENKTSPL
jgi:hypothetical protein